MQIQVSWQKSSKRSVITIEDDRSLVRCKLGFIPQLALKYGHCCEVSLPGEHNQYNQVTSSWYMVRGLVHSTLDANRWHLHAVQPHANACKEALHQLLKLVAIK